MTINFSFSFRSHGLSTSGNNACHGWLSKLKHLFWYEDCFERFGLLVWGCSYHFCPEKDRLKSIFWEMGNLWSMCLEASIKVISEYYDLGILFCSLKRFGRFETVASLDAYQITNYQFLQKFIIFLLSDFWRIREMIFGSEILGPIAWVGVIKKFIWFFKIVPLEVPHFYSSDFTVKGSVY